jgi:hypothetical protein
MSKFIKQLTEEFDESDLITLLEAASIGLSDSETFDTIAESMDLSDEVMVSLRERLHEFMNREI